MNKPSADGVGRQLLNVQGMLGGEHLSLMKLVLPKEGEDFTARTGASCWIDLASTSARYPIALTH